MNVTNQSGVTVILEAMSMSRPVLVTASAGQRECIRGGLIGSDGKFDASATADRGPQLFGDVTDNDDTGWYVRAGDSAGLTAGLQALLKSPDLRRSLGSSARRAAEQHFRFERFIQSLADLLRGPAASPGKRRPA
jgi:glycosyltransferase involved in cell wall biosynthesis